MPQEWNGGWLPRDVGDRLHRDELARQRVEARRQALHRFAVAALIVTGALLVGVTAVQLLV